MQATVKAPPPATRVAHLDGKQRAEAALNAYLAAVRPHEAPTRSLSLYR